MIDQACEFYLNNRAELAKLGAYTFSILSVSDPSGGLEGFLKEFVERHNGHVPEDLVLRDGDNSYLLILQDAVSTERTFDYKRSARRTTVTETRHSVRVADLREKLMCKLEEYAKESVKPVEVSVGLPQVYDLVMPTAELYRRAVVSREKRVFPGEPVKFRDRKTDLILV